MGPGSGLAAGSLTLGERTQGPRPQGRVVWATACDRNASDSRRAAGALGLDGVGLGGLAAQDCPGAPPLPRSEARVGGSSCLPPVPGAWLVLMDRHLWLCPAYHLTRPWGSSLQPLSAVPGHPHAVLRPLCSRVGPLEPCLRVLRRCAFLSPDMLPSMGSSPPSALLDLFLKNLRVSAAGCWAPPHAWPLSPALGPSREPPGWLPWQLPRVHPHGTGSWAPSF